MGKTPKWTDVQKTVSSTRRRISKRIIAKEAGIYRYANIQAYLQNVEWKEKVHQQLE